MMPSLLAALLAALLAVLALALYGFLGWRLRRLERRQEEDRQLLQALRDATQDARPTETGDDMASDDPDGNGSQLPADLPVTKPTEPAAETQSGVDYEAIRHDLQRLPQGEVGLLLLRLHQQASELAALCADDEARRRLHHDFGAPMLTRLQRLVEAIEADRLAAWADSDLPELLNQLARHLSVAAQQAHEGHGDDLAQRLQGWLYDDFGQLCQNQGWYRLDPVVPFETRFDPDRHHALGGRDIDGAAGLVVALKVVGRRYARPDREPQRAQVIVGR